ncbi:MAG: hypothetical protein GX761_05285 [Gammaproteobacteria bacterium]|nr:hypothetical protein [Gammaproteobacteria bacterium]
MLQHLKAVVRVREGNVDHWFDLRPDGSLVDLPASHGGPELFLQRELDKAPLALFFLASLATLIDQHGVDAMDSLLLLSGQWVCNLWLSLDEVGLGGCPCGAGVESDLQAALPDSYARDSLLFSFVAGARLQ